MKKRRRIDGRKVWTAAEEEGMRRWYADELTAKLAQLFRTSVTRVLGKAKRMGLAKSPEFLAKHCRRLDGVIGTEFRFPKGHVPANKGKSQPTSGRAGETQFKPGHKPAKWMPIGSERVVDGYLYRKVSDCQKPGMSRFDWRLVHILNWEATHGPVPPMHAVRFIDGDRGNVDVANLELISRRALMQRNTVHNLPKELVQVVQLRGAVVRQINRRRKRDEEQDRGSA
jgi:hypothetical protein